METPEMKTVCNTIQRDNWKNEKHVPVIKCPDVVPMGELFEVTVTVGEEIAHPNTTEHHIQYITLYFHPDGDKYSYTVAHCQFGAHGASVQGPNTGPVYTHHELTAKMKVTTGGTLHAIEHCNIHGLWEFSKDIRIG